MKKFKVYVESGEDIFAEYIPAKNETEVRKIVTEQYGCEVIKVKDLTEEMTISAEIIAEELSRRFGRAEIDIITRALRQIGIAE